MNRTIASGEARPEGTRAGTAEAGPAWENVRPRTLVDHAVDAIVEGAARGLILPGDRIVEVEMARRLGMSRVPMREAFRILASQGVMTIEPYKGIRLMEVTPERIEQLQDARVALETRAARQALVKRRNGRREIAQLGQVVDEMELMAARRDTYGFATADTEFHRALCGLAGNPVLSQLWESLARQLTIIFGLSTFDKAMAEILEEHTLLIEVFARGEPEEMTAALEDHILRQVASVDFGRIISERRRTNPGE